MPAVESKRCGRSFKIPVRYEDLPEYTVFLHADAPEKLAENMLFGGCEFASRGLTLTQGRGDVGQANQLQVPRGSEWLDCGPASLLSHAS